MDSEGNKVEDFYLFFSPERTQFHQLTPSVFHHHSQVDHGLASIRLVSLVLCFLKTKNECNRGLI